jgi:nickel superoxide dismutase
MQNVMKKALSYILPEIAAEAHCDVPCGIYDPTAAKIAAMTVLRMVMQMNEIKLPESGDAHASAAYTAMIVRRIAVKEEHAALCKKELLTLWTDFFKQEHLARAPGLHDMIWRAAKLCSVNKQAVDEEHARELVSAVDDVARMFYEIKGVPERYAAYRALTEKLF